MISTPASISLVVRSSSYPSGNEVRKLVAAGERIGDQLPSTTFDFCLITTGTFPAERPSIRPSVILSGAVALLTKAFTSMIATVTTNR